MRTAFCIGWIFVAMLTPTQAQVVSPPHETKLVDLLSHRKWQEGMSGWKSHGARIVGEGEERHAIIGHEKGANYVSCQIVSPPTQVLLGASFQYRLEENERGDSRARFSLAFFDLQRSRIPTGFSVYLPATDGQWQTMETSCVLPANAKSLLVSLITENSAQLEVSDIAIRSPRPSGHPPTSRQAKQVKQQPSGPAILRAYAGTSVAAGSGREGVVTFPIPDDYGRQIPLSFAVTTKPEGALKSFRWRRGTDGENLLCEVTVDVAPDEEHVDVRWESYVFVDAQNKTKLPEASLGEFPESVRQWTESTACVQSDNARIKAKAAELAERVDSNLVDYVRSVIAFTRANRGQDPQVRLRSLDAVQALDCGGSCTSRANLCAALLRAEGVPARTQSHLPVWASEGLYEHWLVEYWHPNVGWTWVEPSRAQMQPPPWTLVVLHVSEPEDEEDAFDESIRNSGVASGVAKWSVHNIAPPLRRHRSRTSNGADLALEVKADAVERLKFADDARANFRAILERGLAGDLPAAHDPRVLEEITAGRLPDFMHQNKPGEDDAESNSLGSEDDSC